MKTSIIQSNKLKKLISITIWLFIWQGVYMLINREILIVSPLQVLKTLSSLAVTQTFWFIVLKSMLRIISGFLLAIALGVAVAVLTAAIPFAYDFFYPIISVIRATPVASFILLALIWMKTGTVPFFISFLMVFPIVWSNVLEGIKNADKKLLEMANIFKFSSFKKIYMIYVPSVMPYFSAAAATGVGLAFKSGIAAEVISRPKLSIGGMLYDSKIYIETPELFAWTAVVIILSVIIEKIFMRSIKLLGKKFELKGEKCDNA
ncbi:MAG: ABC transporter permease subunit [Lachnospiraceae bacterium]|nr:ABC transporter permease subunit [Lachnospiraceae bacterium]